MKHESSLPMPSMSLPGAALLLAGLVSGTLAMIPNSAMAQFYGDPPDENHPWAVHDMNRPQPPRVEPGTFSTQDEPGRPPSDAVVLFDGTEGALENWISDRNGEPTKWVVKDGTLQCVPGSGYIRTRDEWGDCQLHIEWSAPSKVEGSSQGRGNSGVFLMGQTEVQVLDNYDNPTYADGFAGSVYGVNPPLANPLHKPGEWQVYDIVFRRPVFRDGEEVDPGRLTVFLNGVLVQDSTPLEGGGGHKSRSKPRPFPEAGPLKLQDHGNPVRYRNIWYRPLPPRAVEGGTDGRLTEEAAMAKRAEIAASLREDAAGREGRERMLRLMESLSYETDAETVAKVGELADAFVADVKATPAEGLEDRKGEVMQVRQAVNYLVDHDRLPEDFAARAGIEEIVKAQDWDERR